MGTAVMLGGGALATGIAGDQKCWVPGTQGVFQPRTRPTTPAFSQTR